MYFQIKGIRKKYIGFEVEIAEAIAKELGIKLNYFSE